MDEQLEHALEGNGIEAAVHEEAAVQVPSPDPAPEEATQTGGEEVDECPQAPCKRATERSEALSESQVKTESPTEEAEKAPDAGLSAEEPAEQGEAEEPEEPAGAEENQPLPGMVVQPRDYYAEWQELAEAHPEVVGKELPEDIYQACMQSELPPLRVYESMMLQKQNKQIAALQQEIATLRQNAENTARAPVVAASEGPANEPEDLFMKGFNSY